MSLKNYSQEKIADMSMLDLAIVLFKDEKKAVEFNEFFNRIAEIKGFTKAQKEEKIAQFYTDLNVDGRFMTIGSNMWGLKRWYPIDQVEEEVTAPVKKKKKAKKKAKKVEDFDEVEEDIEDDLDLDDEDLDLDDSDDDFDIDADDSDDDSVDDDDDEDDK